MSFSPVPVPTVALSPLWAELLNPRPEIFGAAPIECDENPEIEQVDGESERDEAA